MTRETRRTAIAVVTCDIRGCGTSIETDDAGIDQPQFEVLRLAAAAGWALWDGRSVCPTHVRDLVRAATRDADAGPPLAVYSQIRTAAELHSAPLGTAIRTALGSDLVRTPKGWQRVSSGVAVGVLPVVAVALPAQVIGQMVPVNVIDAAAVSVSS